LKLDIEGLNITVTSGGKSGVKPKGKQRAEGLEILGNASLKLKAGVHYALIGRNGTGKSSEYAPGVVHFSTHPLRFGRALLFIHFNYLN
jgi:ABC-type dipeptide/oligopeptide/nickel transport system ATPase subunit